MLISCHSPKRVFLSEITELQSSGSAESRQITRDNISHLPEPVQRYLYQCGFVGRPMANHAEITWKDSYSDIRVASEVAAIWNLPEGDFEYWKGTIQEIKF
jgi:hypothetical protein